MALRNALENLAVESKQDSIITALGNLLTELQQKYEGGAIALDATTLGALESVTATVANWPTSYDLSPTQVATLTPQKDALTDTQLRASAVPVSGTITVANPTTNPETGLAKETTLGNAVTHLSNILGQLNDATADTVLSVLKAIQVELGAKLEAGQSINVANFPATQTVDGTVNVGNNITVSNHPTGLLQDIKRDITDYEERFEFDAAGLPLYVGKALDGTLTTDAAWTVYKFTFTNGLPSRKQVRTGIAWDSRASVVW